MEIGKKRSQRRRGFRICCDSRSCVAHPKDCCRLLRHLPMPISAKAWHKIANDACTSGTAHRPPPNGGPTSGPADRCDQ